MPFADQMIAGAELMLLGMGIVFSFLILLVFALKGMSFFASRYDVPEQAADNEQPATNGQDNEIVAVIVAAIKRYRQQHGK